MTLVDKNPYLESDVIWFNTHTEFDPKPGETTYHWLKFGYACYMRRHHDGIWGDEDWIKFETADDLWSWVISKLRRKIKLYVFCHNTSFDLPVVDIFNILPRRGFVLKRAIIEAPPTILSYRGRDCSITVIDTLNIWRMPLKYLGEEIGLTKLDMPDNNDLQIDWEQYGRRDVEILRAACLKWFDFLESNDYGSFAPTLAGQAMRVYRHKYNRHQIFIDDNKQSLELTREGYYGGRVECFYIGSFTQNFTVLDVNSMYPHVMAYNQFPSKLVGHTRHASIRDLLNWFTTYSLTARVRLRTSKAFAPMRKDGKLIFPIGEYECILSTPELKYAYTNAEILEVLEVSVYEQALLFSAMVHDLYARKEQSKREGDTVKEFMYKKLLNSFYGKWGQFGGKWVEESNISDLSSKRWMEYNVDTGETRYYRQIGGLCQTREEPGETKDSFPAIAAHVTAYARMVLYELIQKAGAKNVYYCDTDCILVNDTGLDNVRQLIDPFTLGGLKIAGTYQHIKLFGPKDYWWDSKIKNKGVRNNALWHNPNTVEQNAWSGLRGLLASGITNRPMTHRVLKHLRRVYDKGVVLQDGSVLPRCMPEDL